MQTRVTLSTQELIAKLEQVEARLQEKVMDLYFLSGMAKELGSPIARESDLRELIDSIMAIIMRAALHYINDLDTGAVKQVGRPADGLRREIGRGLLTLYCRFNDKAGRQSVLTWIDGKLAQEESGQYFDFFKVVMDVVNEMLVNDLGRKPISAAWLARSALEAIRSPASRYVDETGM